MLSVLMAAAVAASPPQLDCKDPQTQTDMNICAGRTYEAADAEMARQYRLLASRMKQTDTAGPEYFAALLESQRAWLKFRDAQCKFEGYLVKGGTAEPLMISRCSEELTKKRTEDLKSLLEAFGS